MKLKIKPILPSSVTSCVAALLCALTLAACTTSKLEELRRITPDASEFHVALSQYYLDLSEDEAQRYDWWASALFSEKGLDAAYNKEILPENPSNWGLTGAALAEIMEAHAQLLAMIDQGKPARAPIDAADAQVSLDCWIERVAENNDPDDIAACKDAFYTAMKNMDYAPSPLAEIKPAPAAATPIAEKTSKDPAELISTAYIVFFEWNRTALTQQGEKIIDDVIAELQNAAGDYELVLNGYTDASGTEEYNLALSEKRAQAVRDYLISHGLKSERIFTFAYGESNPRKATHDGAREQANRRVEIFLEQ